MVSEVQSKVIIMLCDLTENGKVLWVGVWVGVWVCCVCACVGGCVWISMGVWGGVDVHVGGWVLLCVWGVCG